MPTYGYRCESGHEFEVFQSMSEAPRTECQECGKPVRRIFYPVGIVFKGPGFYKTDSRGSSSSTNPAPAAGAAGSGSEATADKPDSPATTEKKAEPKAEKKAESKPASGSGTNKSA
ncbi:MAG: FmdB family zinc ribbon protein [Candidatus Dormibacteria bacterium]